ncbi:P-loop containing nucleoside triphosphate hydrolase protein [Rhizophagus clarus]|uniref:P-loop containing nucleoside triphosphate hydrolase protein n=1 Tax=Rhizophagus clarus TaxID=94130 RepID=A0A8H3LGI5_9GLOM|nr:P-loop containing nucleoside triphosphate hydrolase protein [Rhizophagus clarus]
MAFSIDFNTEQLVSFLHVQNIGLDSDDLDLLKDEKINGRSFLLLTQDLLLTMGFKMGPIICILELILSLKKESNSSGGRLDYFQIFSVEQWSKDHFINWISKKDQTPSRNDNHFFVTLIGLLKDDSLLSARSRSIIKDLFLQRKKDGSNKVSKNINLPSSSILPPSLPLSVKRKHVDDDNIMQLELPLRSNQSLDTFEVLKTVVRHFDTDIIVQGSLFSYKSSNHLVVDLQCYNKVPRENWYFNHIGKDGDPHHLYCDFAIKFNSSTFPIAILELVVTAFSTDLERHYIRIFEYASQLCPDEIWVIHFSCEDNFVPYWPRKRLQKRGLNVIHFWHDKKFKNITMFTRYNDNGNIVKLDNIIIK